MRIFVGNFVDGIGGGEHRLRVLHVRASDGRVAIMADRDVTFEAADKFVVENLRNESNSFVERDGSTVCRCDARAFLAAMLEREEPEKGDARDVEAFAVNPEDRAFFS